MAQSAEVMVRERGQMAVSAQARHRWGLGQRGVVGWIDMGDSVLRVPGGLSQLRNEFLDNADWDSAQWGIADRELDNL